MLLSFFFFWSECNIVTEITMRPTLYSSRPIRLQISCMLAIKHIYIFSSYQDSLGRQRGLSDEDMERVLFRSSKPQKLFCYPEM